MPQSEHRRNILICDDHPVCVVGIELAISKALGKENCRFTRTTGAQECKASIEHEGYDTLVLDLTLLDGDGFEVLEALKLKDAASPTVIILTQSSDPATIKKALGYGVHALVHKSSSLTIFSELFSEKYNEKAYIDPFLQKSLDHGDHFSVLTKRELEVLTLIVQKGYTNKEVAAVLKCSAETVKTHRYKISQKTNTKNRSELVTWFNDGQREAKTGAFVEN